MPTFFRYKGHEVEFYKEIVLAGMGKQTIDAGLETLRAPFVACMRVGNNLLVDCGNVNVDFKSQWTNPAVFDSNVMFDYDEGRKEVNYIKIVKPDENYSIGGLNPGLFSLQDNFMITISISGSDEAFAK